MPIPWLLIGAIGLAAAATSGSKKSVSQGAQGNIPESRKVDSGQLPTQRREVSEEYVRDVLGLK